MNITYTVRPEREQQVIDRVRAELISGAAFARGVTTHLANERVQRCGPPPIRHDEWAGMMASLAAFASTSRFGADVANRIMPKINLYGTPWQAMAAINLALSEIVTEGWFDVVAATGPEPGRASSHQHALTEREVVLLALLGHELQAHVAAPLGSAPGVGWCLQAIAEEHGLFPVTRHVFPTLHRHYEARAAARLGL